MINYEEFINDFPEFSNGARYPASQVNYWGAVANLLFSNPRTITLWDTSQGGFLLPPGPPVLGMQVGGSLPLQQVYVVVTYVTAQGETTPSRQSQILVPADSLLVVQPPVPLGRATGWRVYAGTTQGVYYLQALGPQNQPLVLPFGAPWVEPLTGLVLYGTPPPQTNTAGNKSLLDVAVELFIAHNLSLEGQASDEAALNNTPGFIAGPIIVRTVGEIDVHYDATAGFETNAGHWNLTTYGRRLVRLLRLVGTTVYQVGIGVDPTGGMNGPGWAGPPPFVVGSPGSAVY